ncbi:MAG: amidohydrolase family protein, partial [Fretibacterium sp.]|nr:amidohydrolase family protein [Fretibacterium sp.]
TAMKGAHPEEFISSRPDAGWVASREDVVRTVTFSPTLDPRHVFLRWLLELGVVPSLGHTTAGFEEARAAIDAGARSITHLFNAQAGFHHRAPGMVGAAAVTDVMCELIADGHHVRPELFSPLCRLIGTERLILITDSMRAAGLPDGDYAFGGSTVTVRDGLPVKPDGTIAGSALRMNESIRVFQRATGLPLSEVVGMATRNPARLLGLSRKGELSAGMDADITCFDEDLNVSMTFVGGQRVV